MFTLSEAASKRYEILSTGALGVGIICKADVDCHSGNGEYADLTSGVFKFEMQLDELLRRVVEHEEMYHG